MVTEMRTEKDPATRLPLFLEGQLSTDLKICRERLSGPLRNCPITKKNINSLGSSS